jgi:pimeloyl-ACP methyl ester carboxylesterase
MTSPSSMTSNLTLSPQKHDWRWWISRILLGLLALVATNVLGLLVAGAIAKANLRAQFPSTGQLVDVGGYKLDLLCQGTASGSTVILDAGNGETNLTWSLVQPKVAKFARVCAYDRAGYGWSEASPKPRSVSVMVDELHALLKGAGIQGSLVFVGHSLGGVIARHYAAKYPVDVSGVVLLDSAHEAQFQRLPESVQKATVSGLSQLKTLEGLVGLGLPGLVSMLIPLETRLPPAVAQTERAFLVNNPKQVAATRGELEELMKGTTPPVATLDQLPLVVVSRGRAEPGMDTNTSAQTEQIWKTMQLELTALSSHGRRIVAVGSGHGIQLDKPQVVIDAIRQVLNAQH